MAGVSVNDVLRIDNEQLFNEVALGIFRYQSENTNVYRRFLHYLGKDASSVSSVDDIPFLPVEFFKDHLIISEELRSDVHHSFTSSSTTGIGVSTHHYSDLAWYNKSLEAGFERFMNTENLEISALLPGYLERGDSALVYMVNRLMEKYNDTGAAFFLNEHEALLAHLKANADRGKRNLLIGVTHALIDFAEEYPGPLPMEVMETGGMKGRRQELTQTEIHDVLRTAWQCGSIMGEYGMTELSSQAYSKSEGKFDCPSWMKVKIRERDDPFAEAEPGKTGGINIIDLANAESCSFLATSDLGRIHDDGTFEVLGRFDHSDVRGCSLLVVNI